MDNNRSGVVLGSKGFASETIARLSGWREDISQDAMKVLVQGFLEEATQEMAAYIRTRGVKNGEVNNNGRIRSRDMLRSVGYSIRVDKGRVVAYFGYIHNAPAYALFQEYGTLKQGRGSSPIGIHELLALTDAYKSFEKKFTDAFHNGRVLQLNQGKYASRTGVDNGSIADG